MPDERGRMVQNRVSAVETGRKGRRPGAAEERASGLPERLDWGLRDKDK